jgi:hypothetical protein
MADRYWVGGTGSWNSTAKWSATSGGASGASVPTASDNAIFDANSAAAHYTVTVTDNATCADLTFTPEPVMVSRSSLLVTTSSSLARSRPLALRATAARGFGPLQKA